MALASSPAQRVIWQDIINFVERHPSNGSHCMKIRKLSLIAIAFLLLPSWVRASLDVELQGLEGEAQQNVATYLAAIAPEERDGSYRFKARVERDVRQALQAVGYYQPKITLNEPEGDTLVVSVNPGPRSTWRKSMSSFPVKLRWMMTFIRLKRKDRNLVIGSITVIMSHSKVRSRA